MTLQIEPSLEVLARAGGTDEVVAKKVLLARLARGEAARIGIVPSAAQVQAVAAAFFRGLGLDDESARAWLVEARLSAREFNLIMEDFAAVLAVEAQHQDQLCERVELHRRLISARARTLSGLAASR